MPSAFISTRESVPTALGLLHWADEAGCRRKLQVAGHEVVVDAEVSWVLKLVRNLGYWAMCLHQGQSLW